MEKTQIIPFRLTKKDLSPVLKIMGIDASLTRLGYSFLVKDENNQENHLTSSFSSKLRGVNRLSDIKLCVRSLVEAHRPDIIFIEGYAYGPGLGSRNVDLAELGGVLRVLFYEMGITYVEIPPAHLKKYVSGAGNAKKELMLVSCLDKFGIKFTSNDECDAYCLAKFGMELLIQGPDSFCRVNQIKMTNRTYSIESNPAA